MSVVNSTPLLLGDDGYQISRSVRLRSSASAYLNRTLTTGSSQKWTWSGWVKRGNITVDQTLFSRFIDTNTTGGISFVGAGALQLLAFSGGSAVLNLITTQVFRDPSAHYYLTVSLDTTQATASNRAKIWVNGVQVTSLTTATYPAQNSTGVLLNGAGVHKIGMQDYPGYPNYFDGYLTEINFIDGQALTPSSFGEFDAITGVWKPKKYAGTYGTNGFYLNFADNSAATAAAIGKDFSGNGNNWTPNNISVTAGATYDSMLDVPTMWADGGNGRGNYATLNPLNSNAVPVTSYANLRYGTPATATNYPAGSTFAVSSGKWYFEATLTTVGGNFPFVGIGYSTNNYISSILSIASFTGTLWVGNGGLAIGDVVGIAFDLDNLTFTAYKNNVVMTVASTFVASNTIPSGQTWSPCISALNKGAWDLNFGQRPFAYTPPTGFKALNTQNLPDATIKKGAKYMAATLYTGTGGTVNVSNAVNGVSFQPDFVWIKNRGYAQSNTLYDSIRGVYNVLVSNSTVAEDVEAANHGLSAFASNGFTLIGDTVNQGGVNTSPYNYVGWQWKESASAGFDIVTYTGTLTTSGTVAINHSLGVAPKMVISKSRNNAGVDSGAWFVWTSALSTDSYLRLNTTAAAASVSGGGGGTMVAPTSSVFYTPYLSGGNINANNYIAYLFAEVPGFSKFGRYTGNGSTDGTFVYLGFRPRFVMIKRTDVAAAWVIFDTTRNPSNLTTQILQPNDSTAEITGSGTSIDILSNGFKPRNAGAEVNVASGTYIYMAFAENPFKNALAR